MHSLEGDTITAKLSLFMPYPQIAYQAEPILKKKFSNSMISSESNKMTPV